MDLLCEQVTDCLPVLLLLGRRQALLASLDKLATIHAALVGSLRQLAVMAAASTTLRAVCAEASRPLRHVLQLVTAGLAEAQTHQPPTTWLQIHEQLMIRLREAGFPFSPQQLEQLHLLGSPGHLVQVLFATGALAPAQFAAQGAIQA